MTNVIKFPQRPRIEINYGELISRVVIGAEGRMERPDMVGTMRFFVDVVEIDGGRIGMWDGSSYEEAILQAGDLAVDLGAVVHDLVARGDAL